MMRRFHDTTQTMPKAIQHLRQLHLGPPSRTFSEQLELFKTAKEHRFDIFTAGILLFTKLANLSPSERTKYYGTPFAGVNSNNDLANLWNASFSEPIEAHRLDFICPSDWDYQLEKGYSILVYRGDDVSAALDKLLQGPAVIDCGMFCQLSIWFGIKYMLGNDLFNEVFGHAPFYLTQLVYAPICSPTTPYMGNPLYPFFDTGASKEKDSGVSIIHVRNHMLYQLKHPGGNYGGDNCIVINGKYIIFDPTLEATHDLSRYDVEQLLLKAFNAPQNAHDTDKLKFYAERDALSVYPGLGMSFGELISKATEFSSFTAKAIESEPHVEALDIQFNFERFCRWVAEIRNVGLDTIDYTPLKADELVVPSSLIGQIPHENRATMSFSAFTVKTPLQREMYALSQKFSFDVMLGHSVCIILTGKAGIGKTAAAVSCAKELSSRGKSVIWISEVMVRGWADKATGMEELEACSDEIRRLLAANPDAVFLDDDNLVGYSGRVLLEEIYMWYAGTPGKGLFITSNEPITLKNCYGLDLDEKYHFPPFPGYTSPQYENTIVRCGLSGQSMRLSPTLIIMNFSDQEKMTALARYSGASSVGIIIDPETYKTQKHVFAANIELVPAFPEEIIVAMTQSLMADNTLGPAYDQLSPEQRKYIQRHHVNKSEQQQGWDISTGLWYDGIKVRAFERTDCSIIAIELLSVTHWNEEIIDKNCFDQLLRVVNYAHNCGGKKVILINRTKFTPSELLDKIKEGIPERERERTLARIDTLLFSAELARASQHEEGKIEQPSLELSQALEFLGAAIVDVAGESLCPIPIKHPTKNAGVPFFDSLRFLCQLRRAYFKVMTPQHEEEIEQPSP